MPTLAVHVIHYRDRNGRSIRNDDDLARVLALGSNAQNWANRDLWRGTGD
jgi:hypothetical protein